MSVRQDSKGRWVSDYYDSFGKRHAFTFRKQTQAEKHERAQRTKHTKRRRPTIDPDADLNAVSDLYLDDLERGRTVRPQTLDSYRATLRDHWREEIGTLRLVDIDREHVYQAALGKLGGTDKRAPYAKGTVAHALVILSAVFTFARKKGLIDAAPTLGIAKDLKLATGNPRARRKDQKIRALDRKQLARLIENTDEEMLLATCLMAWAGLRVSEVLALKFSDLKAMGEENTEVLVVSRTAVRRYGVGPSKSRERQIPIPAKLREMLREAQEDAATDWLYPEMGTPTSTVIGRLQGRIYTSVRAAGDAANVVGMAPQMCRHTFATNLLQAGVSPAKVQAWLGHESIETTLSTYGNWLPHIDGAALEKLTEDTAPK